MGWRNYYIGLDSHSIISLNNGYDQVKFGDTVKPLNSGHLRVLKSLSVIKKCPLLGGSLTKIVKFETKHFVRYSRQERYLGRLLLGGFTVVFFRLMNLLVKRLLILIVIRLIQSHFYCNFLRAYLNKYKDLYGDFLQAQFD